MKPSPDFQSRLDAARQFRNDAKPEIQEALEYCIPGRENDFDNQGRKVPTESETFYSAEDLTSDLAGDFITYFTPPEQRWSEYLILERPPEEIEDEVLKIVEAREQSLFNEIESSNYYDVAPQWGMECAAHGTPALWVTTGHISQPIFVESVPCHELLITPGHMGYLDRFREKSVCASTIPALFAGWDVDLSDAVLQRKIKAPRSPDVMVIWGFWLDWEDPGNPQWKCEITADGKSLMRGEAQTLGPMAGSCPLLVGRFNPQPGKPWGRGPGIKALQDLRVIDKMNELVLSGLDQALTNTLIYADDGFLDFETGIVPGTAYPAHRGFSREKVYELNHDVNLEQGWFASDKLEDRIRACFYQDGPRQRGDTPPTATQWLEERRRVQQRIAKPSAPIWTELILPFIQRVELLAVMQGKIPEAISHNGQAIKVRPITPLQKAQNQDDIMTARSNLGLIAEAMGPEGLAATVDMAATAKNIITISGDRLTKVKDADAAQTGQPPGTAAPVPPQAAGNPPA